MRHQQRFHIAAVHFIGKSIHRREGLHHNPVFRQNLSIKPLHIPHSIVLDDYPVWFVLFLKFPAGFLRKLLFFLDDHTGNAVLHKQFILNLMLSLFTEDQQSLGSVREISLLDHFLNTGSLSTFQKTSKQINWYFFISKHEPFRLSESLIRLTFR